MKQENFKREIEYVAKLARNNINILDVKYDKDGYLLGVEFEYGWKITPVSTKWTRAYMSVGEPLYPDETALCVYDLLLKLVKEVRDSLEG